MGCGCGKLAGKYFVVDVNGQCLIPDGVGGCRAFNSATMADAEATRRGLTGYGLSQGVG